jgi:predicted RNase H-like nuclease (RuvC/YqgF family)
LADVERENNILKDGTVVKRLTEQIRELERENAQTSALRMRLNATEKQLENLSATYSEMIESRQEALSQAELLNRELLKLRDEQTAGSPLAPDYEATRDRTLNKLKMGKQSTQGKAIDAFIKELKQG